MSEVVILHNPRCSKSRATLALIESRGIKPRIIDYLADPPSLAEIERMLNLLGLEPRALMRHDEAEYTQLGLDDPGLGRAELIAAMHAHPRLIQRPVVLANGKAALGRPPESVLAIL
ncbi:arsenate reductase (glutaredoxin) [Dokdonella sp.]|uniref:arsenate reductase (glutaredoxin) n=1 Tax=Dokdonella sp. TaxID=2291710 RepID=UPI0031BE896A|nr:arsenate reductase (glutaredoxin) [Dokdonella sp.]